MKAIFHVVTLLVAGGAAFFSFSQLGKFKDTLGQRQDAEKENTSLLVKIETNNRKISEEQKKLADLNATQETATQSVSALRSAGASLKRKLADIDSSLETQDAEVAELEKTIKDVGSVLSSLDQNVTIDNLGDKIQELQNAKKASEDKLLELTTLTEGAEKNLAAIRADQDRLAKKKLDRSTNIRRNSVEAVITAVNADWGFVVIGAGSNSGFTPQTSLLVERDGRFIGRVRPSSIEPTQTIAEIDTASVAAGVRFQPGDSVILAKPAAN